MAFADDDFCTPNRVSKLKKLFEHIMVEEGFLLDDEVPLERKLLVSLSVARSAAGTRCQIQDGKIKSVEKCRAFLNSDTMLERLIFNVLTVPTIQLSGDGGLLSPIQASAEDSLYDIINAVAKDPPFTAQDFISTALTDGTRVGEDYLGYKDRPEVTEHLEKIFERQMSSVASHTGGAAVQGKETNHAEPIAIEAAFPPCVVLLNGFPGVGKYCISRELETIIPRETRLIDNHILIDPVEAIHPGRTPQHYQLRKTIRNAAFDAIKNLQSRNVTVLMTSCLSSSDADIEAFSEHLDIARCRKVPFILVNVLCAAENNLTRLQSLERVRGQKSKLTDPTVLQEIREKAKLLDPVYSILDVQDVRFHYLEIDSTTKTAAEAADAVARFVTALTAHKAPNRAGQQDLSLFWRVVSVLSQLNQWLVRRL
ncbi:hypothetical protein MMC30_001715 [Trapelia coarctata]|nr:hypothetical protein [Trapelia coarctata]